MDQFYQELLDCMMDGDDETGGEGTVDETAPEADGEEF